MEQDQRKDGHGWTWMDMDGHGWTWMDMDKA